MTDTNPSTAPVVKDGVPEVESRSVNRSSSRDDNEKGDFEHDEVINVAPFKVTFKIFMSLTAMAFLWVGSQIPLYLFGSVLAVIYSDIGGADRWTWFVVGYLIPNAAICPFVGALSDLFGPRGVAVVGQLFLIIGPVVTSAAHTMNDAIAGSVLSGFGAGLNELIALSGTAELVPARLRGAYVAGLVFTILPFVPATLYAQVIADVSSWRYNGIFVAVWNVIGLVLVLFFYKPSARLQTEGQSKKEILRRVDYVGGILSTIGVTCFMMGLEWGASQYSWSSAHVLAPFFIGIVFIAAFFVWEARFAPHPMVPKKLFSKDKKTMIVILIITFLSGANFFAILLLWPTQNYSVYDYDPVGIGLRTLPVGAGILIGSFVALVLITISKGRIKLLMLFFTAMMTAGTGAMSVANRHNLPTMYGVVSIAALGVGGVIIPCSIIAQLVCPDELIGTITAITLSIRYIGGAIGFGVYDNILFHKFVTTATEHVGLETIVGGGLVNITSTADLGFITELVSLAGNAQFKQLKAVLATDPRIIGKNAFELIVAATQESWVVAYKWPYWTSIAWGGVCVLLSLFLGDITKFLDNHVAADV